MRVRLECDLPVARVLLALRDEPWPFALTGRWAGGGAIVGASPRALLAAGEDPFSSAGGSAGAARRRGGRWRLVRLARLRPRRARRGPAARRGRFRSRTRTSRSTTTCCARTPRGRGGSSRSTRRRAADACARCSPRRRLPRRPTPVGSRCALRAPRATSPPCANASSGSPPARSSRPTCACGSRQPGTVMSRSSSRAAASLRPDYGACFVDTLGRDRQPLAGALPAPPRPERTTGRSRAPRATSTRPRLQAREGPRRARDDRRPDAQ